MPRTIEDILAELKEALLENADAQEAKAPRSVAKKAKNIEFGEVVDLPYFGLTTIYTWSRNGDEVILGNSSKQVSVGSETRLTVRRAHVA